MLIFFDESGDSGMNNRPGSSRLFVVTAVLFKNPGVATACDSRIDELRDELRLGPRHEFHFNKLKPDLRDKFLKGVAGFDFLYSSFVLNKSKAWGGVFQSRDTFYSKTATYVLDNLGQHMENAQVVMDKSGNRNFYDKLSKRLQAEINPGDGPRRIKKIKTQESHKNNLLQLADMVCGAVARSCNMGKKDAWSYRKIIRPRELRVQHWPK